MLSFPHHLYLILLLLWQSRYWSVGVCLYLCMCVCVCVVVRWERVIDLPCETCRICWICPPLTPLYCWFHFDSKPLIISLSLSFIYSFIHSTLCCVLNWIELNWELVEYQGWVCLVVRFVSYCCCCCYKYISLISLLNSVLNSVLLLLLSWLMMKKFVVDLSMGCGRWCCGWSLFVFVCVCVCTIGVVRWCCCCLFVNDDDDVDVCIVVVVCVSVY